MLLFEPLTLLEKNKSDFLRLISPPLQWQKVSKMRLQSFTMFLWPLLIVIGNEKITEIIVSSWNLIPFLWFKFSALHSILEKIS